MILIINDAEFCTDFSQINEAIKEREKQLIENSNEFELIPPFKEIYESYREYRLAEYQLDEEERNGIFQDETYDYYSQKEKTFSEIKYVESKLVELFNEMNKIESRNYNIAIGEISKETTQSSSGESSSSSGSGGGQGGTSSGEETSNSGDSGSSSNSKQDNKKFELEISGVLTNKEDINWEYIKGEIENLYSSISTITLDLLQINVTQEEILAFNSQLDNLAVAVKDENKENTLSQMSTLYDTLATITQKIQGEETYKILVEIKQNVFKAYSKLDTGNWNEIANDTNNAITSYSKLLSNTNIEPQNQYIINKGYILINELQNAVNLQDTSVFLIKYKYLLEELNSL